MPSVNLTPVSPPELGSILLALVSMSVALSTLFVAGVAMMIVMLTVAALVLAATGVSSYDPGRRQSSAR
ncbi:hypothetical protein C4K88_16685 [Arthrobacter pityocampae]|uniref:Uncharacterized protein n=1 Tax=Arthrobacter pityocampae TaxID=547334 RepID=A0A2S5ITJ3_9MICC|nr:hypothetical protein [Arthrobacter pityocampae]PPB47865.1 hypothetical protein C4K88_16685 [Arthrobacter pityocampae]